MADDDNKCKLFYMNGIHETVYRFKSLIQCGKWEADVMSLKHSMEDILNTYATFGNERCNAYARWIVKYNTFVLEWTQQRTPDDIVAAKDSIIEALNEETWTVE